MLKIEFSMPAICNERTKLLSVCAEIDEDTIFLQLKACAHCRKIFVPIRTNHRFCYRGRCRKDFNESIRTQSVRTDPSKP